MVIDEIPFELIPITKEEMEENIKKAKKRVGKKPTVLHVDRAEKEWFERNTSRKYNPTVR